MSESSLIMANNVIHEGKLLDPQSTDDKVLGIRRYLEMLVKDTSALSSVHYQIRSKGHDKSLFH
jgi:predicted O-methyltransferase YrrM